MTKANVRKLKELRRTMTMDAASFDNLWPDPKDPLPTTEAEVTEFIKRRTRLWRETWILSVLDEILGKVPS